MSAIVLDTETTGIDAPEVIELAWLGPMAIPSEWLVGSPGVHGGCQRFRPSKPIGLGAMAAHHIIDSDLADCPAWDGWELPDHIEYLIGHNVDFDWKAISSPSVKRICTLALSRYLWPQIDSHTLTAMTYHIYEPAHAREMVRAAHSAAADVQLCHHLLGRIWLELGKPATWEDFWLISERARVPTVMTVGKHKGMPIKDVPRDYKQWFLRQPDVDPYLAKALAQ